MELFKILRDLEVNEEKHLARLLVLLNAFESDNSGKIEGFTKLAKLDFLLRYPTYLEKALQEKGKDTKKVNIRDFEKRSVESSMVRYRYGPWDFRYRKFINILSAKGLVKFEVIGKSIHLQISEEGKKLVQALVKDDAFKDLNARAKILKTNFNLNGTTLMKFIYATFPEIGNLDYGRKI